MTDFLRGASSKKILQQKNRVGGCAFLANWDFWVLPFSFQFQPNDRTKTLLNSISLELHTLRKGVSGVSICLRTTRHEFQIFFVLLKNNKSIVVAGVEATVTRELASQPSWSFSTREPCGTFLTC